MNHVMHGWNTYLCMRSLYSVAFATLQPGHNALRRELTGVESIVKKKLTYLAESFVCL